MHPIELREATPADAEAITQLVNLAYRPKPDTESWTHEAALVEGDRISLESVKTAVRDSVVLVAVQESTIVGCVQIEARGPSAHIGMLAVDPAHQTAGLGKLILQRAEAFSADKLRAQEAVLVVIAARTELIEFYLRRGYRETGERLPYPIEAGVGVPTEKALSLTVLKKAL